MLNGTITKFILFCSSIIICISAFGFRAPDNPSLPDFDLRRNQKQLSPSQRQLDSAKKLFQDSRITVKFDPILSSPRWIYKKDGFLNSLTKQNITPRNVIAPDPLAPLKAFINANSELFGFTSDTLNSATIKYDYITQHNNVRTIVWQQKYNNLDIFNALFIAHITAEGLIVNISSMFIADPKSSVPDSLLNENQQPQITVEKAVAIASEQVGCSVQPQDIKLLAQPQGAEFKTILSAPALRGETTARLLWFPINSRQMQLCWEILLTSQKNGETYRLIIDANTGVCFLRQCLTRYATPATFRVFTKESPTPMMPGHSAPSTQQPQQVERELVTLIAADTNASPIGWVYENLNRTSGNNAEAYLDRNANNQPDLPGTEGSPPLVFDFPLDLSQQPTTYGNATVVNLFYWVNWMHDKLYQLGFTEETGNFQKDNFGRSGFGNDPLMAEAQDGDGYNNANMTTPPDGTSPRMQMFIFTGPSPNRDGALDTQVVLHEYTHGLSDRLVGGGPGLGTLQALGLGEGWSDFFALALLSRPEHSLADNYPMAAYIAYLFNGITQNYYFGIRRYPYSTNLNVNPLTFKDIDPTQASPHTGIPRNPGIGGSADEVHNMGEVWCVTLWEMRANLIRKYGFEQGNYLAMRLVVDGMKYSPPNPDFLEARDAILTADLLSSGGANRNEIWSAFAKRGMGFFAKSPDSSTTLGVVEDFNLPDDLFAYPTGDLTASGPVGGPFNPYPLSITLTNNGLAPINWAACADGMLNLSVRSGTLLPSNSPTVITASFNSALHIFPPGVYTTTIFITNLNSGIVQRRNVKLLIGQVDFFVEMFDSYDNDLDYSSITFIPDGSPGYYRACRQQITNFFTDPSNGTTVTLDDDSRVQVVLPDNMYVEIYGIRTNAIWIGANGEVSFAQGDTRYFYPQLSAFYEYPRVAPLYVDLNPATGGTVSWKALSDRVAVTWLDVPEYGKPNRNSFQAELFTNGTIRMTWLNIETLGGMSGLSKGGGVPQGLIESDFSTYPICGKALTIIVPLELSEGDGILRNAGTIILPEVPAQPVTINLYSTDIDKVTLPESVIITAGANIATFDINIIDNNLLDGTQFPLIIASAPGYTTASTMMRIYDNENSVITINLPSTINENADKVQGTISLSTAPQKSLAVEIATSDTNIISLPVPPLILFAAGQTNASFQIAINNNETIDGTRNVTLSANVTNWTTGKTDITIIDDEGTNITLILPLQVAEGSGLLKYAGAVYLDGIPLTNVTIYLSSSDTNNIQVPEYVTIDTTDLFTLFDIYVGDNNELDGPQTVTITATSPGFTSAQSQIIIVDDELPVPPYSPYPPDKATNIPVNLILRWSGGNNDEIINGDFESGNLTGWNIDNTGFGGWMLSDGGLNPGFGVGELSVYSGRYSIWCVQGGTGKHKLSQKVSIPQTAISAILSLAYNLINGAESYSTNHYFRIDITDETNKLLTTLFFTAQDAPRSSGWIYTNFNLTQFKGKFINIVFIEEDTSGNLFVGLDNISLKVDSHFSPEYELYFGTNSSPESLMFIGRTTNNFWVITNLNYATTYYWQVSSISGQTRISSPVWSFRTINTVSKLVFIDKGSIWHYSDEGIDYGSVWNSTNFNDVYWKIGIAPLGYGMTNINTPVNYGNNPSNKYITTYFRKHFVIQNTNNIQQLHLSLLADDGAAVYLNGQEVFRFNLPPLPETINYTNPALSEINNNYTYIETNIPVNLLCSGTNIIAVEIHQASASGEDIIFDLELTSIIIGGTNLPPQISLVSPAPFTILDNVQPITLYANAYDQDGSIKEVQFYIDNKLTSVVSTSSYSFIWSNQFPGFYTIYAVAIDNIGSSNKTSDAYILVNSRNQTLTTLLKKGSKWKYLDDGSNQGIVWRGYYFDDSSWSDGYAPLGYNIGDEATTLSYGNDYRNKYITYYFRHSFTNTAIINTLIINLRRDDGAVVYINGYEVLRNNMPPSNISYTTTASSPVIGDYQNTFLSFTVQNPPIITGKNVVAVEVHQASPDSPDLIFDMELVAIANYTPSVKVITPTNNSILVAGRPITITADAYDPYGSIAKVEYFSNSDKLGESSSYPYQFIWTNPPSGTYSVYVRATDNSGLSSTSQASSISVYPLLISSYMKSGQFITLGWQNYFPDAILEYTTNLSGGNWYPITNNIILSNGIKYHIISITNYNNQYFRLKLQ